ncbi:MAG: hypothetical protein JSR82_10925 [Verrucomicrobia bacterium]|nr:hypothetical protein [Verrucomicrobiota bacterium]
MGCGLVFSLAHAQNAPIVVTSSQDNGPGTLRAALEQAASQAGPDRITFDAALNGRYLSVTTAALQISAQEVEIDASALSRGVYLALDFNATVPYSGPLVVVAESAKLKMNRVGVDGAPSRGLTSSGTLELIDCDFFNCVEALVLGGRGSTTATRCSFGSNNGAVSAFGSGFVGASPSSNFTNCTFVGNARIQGGGAVIIGGGNHTFTHCTFAYNHSGYDGGAMSVGGIPGIADGEVGVATLVNCIVAANTSVGQGDISIADRANLATAGANLIGNNAGISAVIPAGPLVGTPNAPLDPRLGNFGLNGGTLARTIFPSPGSPAIDAAVGSTATEDGRGRPRPVGAAADLGAVEVGNPDPARARMRNVSTRVRTAPGDSSAILGFAVREGEKRVAIRVLGPSLSAAGVTGVLANPSLRLFRSSDGAQIGANEDWQDDATSAAALNTARLAPTNALESALVATLPAGNYTVVVQGANATAGVCLVEAYDLATSTSPKLINVSTRGQIGTGDNAMIAGIVVGPGATKRVLIRALGPSLAAFGVTGTLQDPTIEVRDTQIALGTNDDWQNTQAAAITASGFAPTDPRESAIILNLPPGSYTAIVRGKGGTTGNGIVEVYELE